MFAWHNRVRNPSAVGNAPPHVVATAKVAQAVGLSPRQVSGLGIQHIAAVKRVPVAHLLDQAGIGADEALAAGLFAPQPEYLSPGPSPISCQCAARRYPRRDLMLGALTLDGLFDDAVSSVTSLFGGDASTANQTTDASYTEVPNNDGSMVGGTVAPTTAPSMADGWPAAPPFRAGNWFFGDANDPTPKYTLAQGDTVSGMSRLYLQSPARYLEIWDLQPFRWTYKMDPSSKNPGRGIREGDVFIMPLEARDQALKLLKTQPTAPATPGAPGSKPNAVNGLDPSAPHGALGFVEAHKTALLVAGGVAAVAAVLYAAT